MRRASVSLMIGALSRAPAPRETKARQTCSRRSRRAENCRNGSTDERSSVTSVFAGMAALLGGGGRRGARGVRQALQVRFVQDQRIGFLVAEHVLAEGGAERGEPLGDLGEALLLLRREPRAGALEREPAALDEALRLRVEAGPVCVDGVDAREQGVVEQHIGFLAGEARLDLALDRLDGVGRGRADEMVEGAGDAVERLAGALQAEDGVFEARGGGLDGVPLGPVLGEGGVEGRAEMFEADLENGGSPKAVVQGVSSGLSVKGGLSGGSVELSTAEKSLSGSAR